MRSRRYPVLTAAVLAVLLCAGVAPGATGRVVRIAVLVSYSGAPFGEAVKGFHRSLAGEGFTTRYTTYHLDGNRAKASRAVQEIKKDKPHLVFALGSLAAEAVLREPPDVPVVAGMVLRQDTVRSKENATGVYLEFGPTVQFQWLRRILPEAKTVGVLYNPGENRERIEEAARIASEMGLRLEAREVHSPRDLPTALESLAGRADVLWGVYDSMVLAPETAKHILLFSFRHRIPVIGPSASWVKAGALYSLEWDYEDVGVQCGEKALGLLREQPGGSIPMAPPRKILYALNLNTAKRMGIDLPESLVRSSGQIFQGER